MNMHFGILTLATGTLVVLVPSLVFCAELYVFTEMESFSNSVGNVSILEEVNVKIRYTACWRICHRHSQCASYFENTVTGMCRLMSTNVSKEEVFEESGWKYLVKTSEQMKAKCPTYLGFTFDEETNLCIRLWAEVKMFRSAAIGNCTAIGGRLLRIQNEKQHTATVNYMKTFYPNFSPCIDGRRPDNNGTSWSFENGEALSYFHWGDDEPEIYKRCIKLAKGDDFNWASIQCSLPLRILCEIPLE